jgi:hypothetical protein
MAEVIFRLATIQTNVYLSSKRNILGGTWVYPRYVNPDRPFE